MIFGGVVFPIQISSAMPFCPQFLTAHQHLLRFLNLPSTGQGRGASDPLAARVAPALHLPSPCPMGAGGDPIPPPEQAKMTPRERRDMPVIIGIAVMTILAALLLGGMRYGLK